ncbi:agamous-like MADS-box protein AGL80 [Tanacetum coccineum]
MTRPCVKLQFKIDPKARKETLKKRKKGLIKKMNEVKILCDVDACLVMYETPDADALAEVWPSHSEAVRVIQKFEEAKKVSPFPELDRKAFIQKSIVKAEKELKKDLEGLCGALDNQLKLIDEALEAKAGWKGKEKMI